MPRSASLAALLLAATLASSGAAHGAADGGARIVLIGGTRSEGPLRHDYPNGIRILKQLIESSPDLRGLAVDAHPDGWPDDPRAFDGAGTVVWYFDGVERHPLRDRNRRAGFAALMARGVGVVALHQASTQAADDDGLDLSRWLGAARHGMVDRVDETADLAPSTHPVARGVSRFKHFDEFYPTIRFISSATPVLSTSRYVAAWAFERPGGGRAFGFSGAHYLSTFDAEPIRTLLLNAILWTAGHDVPPDGARATLADAARPIAARLDHPTFHHDPQRSGWNAMESALTPRAVAGESFGLMWETPQFDAFEGQPPRLYASPLYLDRVAIAAGEHRGATLSVVFAASNTGHVYAVNAFASQMVPAGAILWRTRLGEPCRFGPAPLDGVPTGVLSTPVIDSARAILYVTHCDPRNRWQAYALHIGSGAIAAGWPVRLDEEALNAPGMNRNAGASVLPARRRYDFRVQRAALNLSPDRAYLYVGFGETETGWLVSVDTARARIASAFATQAVPHRGSGGIWGAGGPAVDDDGLIYVVTGTGFGGYIDRTHDWTQSVLQLAHEPTRGFALRGTYTPFNHCRSAQMDIDLGSGGASLVPGSSLLVVGGKQGNAYLLDRARLPGRLDRRPPCGGDAASDASLLPPDKQPQFGTRGPLNVFGPYSETDAAMDLARGRSVPATFRDAHGRAFAFVTGNTRMAEGSPEGIAPSLARLEIVAKPGEPAYLRIDQVENTLVFENPGSPVVSSNGARDAVVWVLDENARRSALLAGPDAPRPVLHALDAMTLRPLWKSPPGELSTSGKYNQPLVARGRVFVGTDRIQAFGLGPRLATRAAVAEAPAAPPSTAKSAAAPRDAGALYRERCAGCHQNPQGSTPPRTVIATQSHARIVEVMTLGAMRSHAEGMSAAEIDAVARFLQ